MNKLIYALLFVIGGVSLLSSCDDTETYAEQKEEEKSAINSFISKAGITVISESEFNRRFADSTYVKDGKMLKMLTDTTTGKNEYVLFSTSGVYMQIVDLGVGTPLKSGTTTSVIARFTEWNLESTNPIDNPDSCQLTNQLSTFISTPDIMSITNTSGTFTATFSSGVMCSSSYGYGSSYVPSGWLKPFTYINVGRPDTEDEKIAHVHLIVPSSQGQEYASSNVYPCYYDLTFQK